jgi:predicted RNA binding protein YcfA (HicA-like mRNA interferase family)
MSKLPICKPRELIKVLKKYGFVIDHQTGSHVIMEKPNHPLIVTIPMHNRDLKKGTLKAILKQAQLNVQDLIKKL